MGRKEREAKAEPSLTRRRERLSDPGVNTWGRPHDTRGAFYNFPFARLILAVGRERKTCAFTYHHFLSYPDRISHKMNYINAECRGPGIHKIAAPSEDPTFAATFPKM